MAAPVYRTSSAGGGTSGSGNRSITITPAVGDLLVILVQWSGNSNTSPTCTDNNGSGAYDLIGTALNNASGDIQAVFVRTALMVNTTSTVITPVVGSGNNTAGEIVCLHFSGMARAGSGAVRQSGKQQNQTTGVPTPVLPANALTGNPTITSAGSSAASGTLTAVPNASWTERSDAQQATPPTALEVATRDSGFTSTSAAYVSIVSVLWNAFIIELDGTSPISGASAGVGSSTSSLTGTGALAGAITAGTAASGNTTVATDSFTRADTNTLGTNYSVLSDLSSCNIVSNAVGVATLRGNVWTADSLTDNHFSQFKLVKVPSASAMAAVRASNASARVYYLGGDNDNDSGNHKYGIWRLNANGTRTQLAIHASQTSAVNDVVRLEVSGNNLTLYVNEISIVTASDSTQPTGGGAGIRIENTPITDAVLDDFACGNIGSGAGGVTGTLTGLSAISGTSAGEATSTSSLIGLSAVSGTAEGVATDSVTLIRLIAFTASAGAVTLSGTSAGLLRTGLLTASAGSVAISGTAATLKATRLLSVSAGAYSLTGTSASLLRTALLNANSGTFSISGTSATLAITRYLSPVAGSFLITGTAASLRATRDLTAGSGSVDVTGSDADPTATRKIAASSGSVSITGTDADLIYDSVSSDFTLNASSGSFAISGSSASLLSGRLIHAGSGTFSITGSTAALIPGLIQPPVVGGGGGGRPSRRRLATFTNFPRNDRHLVFPALSGTFQISGKSAQLHVGRRLLCGTGELSVTGMDVEFTADLFDVELEMMMAIVMNA